MNSGNKESRLYAVIGILAITSACCLVAMAVVLARDSHNRPVVPTAAPPAPDARKGYCSSEACRRTAVNLLLAVDRNADPCHDFYDYACGLWSRLHPIQEGYGRLTAFSELADQNLSDLQRYMDELRVAGKDDSVNKLLKQTYDSCMNETAIEDAGSKPLMKLFQDVFEHAKRPNDDDWTLFNFNGNYPPLELVLGRIWKMFGSSIIVTASVGADEGSTPSKYLLHLDQSSLSLGANTEDYYLKNDSSYAKLRASYLKFIERGFSLFAHDHRPTVEGDHSRVAQRVLDFETALARVNVPAEKRRNPAEMYHKMRVDQLNTFGGYFNLTAYMEYLNPNIAEVNVVSPAYFKNLDVLLRNTSKETVFHYVGWRLMMARFPVLSTKYSNIYYEFLKILRDQEKEKDRSKFCLRYIVGEPDDGSDFLGYAIGRLFVEKKGFKESSKNLVVNMVDALGKAFRQQLVENTWMDEETKEKARSKSMVMISNIGYPDMLMNNNNLTDYYRPLLETTPGFSGTAVTEDDGFFQLNSKILSWLNQRDLNKLNKPFDRYSFGGSPAIVNAWYNSVKNSIVFPAGILQPPFFEEDAPLATNFGSIGTVIGHEISHAFDDEGSRYNGFGKLENWWSNASAKAFQERVQCIADQYSRFCYPNLGADVCVKGRHTQGENIADNSGLKQSYAAYKEMTKNVTELPLPGLEEYSMDQIFFLSFANFWCANFRDNYLKNLLETNVHAPGRDRVIGTLQNFDQFARVFRCPPGSRMNPKSKCVIW